MEPGVSHRRFISLAVCTLRCLTGPSPARGAVGRIGNSGSRGAGFGCGDSAAQPVKGMPQGVQLAQIEQIFAILDRLSISREAVVIPLRPQGGGGVKRLSNGKLEIIVPADLPFEQWYTSLEGTIRQIMP
jgi:organic radical activating enzyme